MSIRTAELKVAVEELTKINARNKKDLLVAKKLQDKLIPIEFSGKNFSDIASAYLPMDELGGDLFDVYEIDENRTAFMILDVCGHGVPASLVTAMAKIFFVNAAKELVEPVSVMFKVNNELFETVGAEKYLTAFYGVLDTGKGVFYYVNAGHPDVLVVSQKHNLQRLGVTGSVMGVLENLVFAMKSVPITKGDRIVLYTDGIIETMNKEKSLFGADVLEKLILKYRAKRGNELINIVFKEIASFRGKSSTTDDCAMLVVDV